MLKNLLSIAALAAATLVTIPAPDAEARRGAGFRGGVVVRAVGVRPAFRPRVVVRGPVIVRRPVRYRVARPVFAAPVAVVSSCGWLRHRAITSGSAYWWHRYRVCRGW